MLLIHGWTQIQDLIDKNSTLIQKAKKRDQDSQSKGNLRDIQEIYRNLREITEAGSKLAQVAVKEQGRELAGE